ncbi:hypothetical protein SRHO_G00032580 [Serrasalmus rhombeus]
MPPNASKQPKESLQSATGMEHSISREASQATSDEALPLVWEKVSNKILKILNERLKLDDLEGRSRRNNIKIVGVPEGEEKGKPVEFVAGLLPKLLGATHFVEPLIVDRAHRVLQPKPPEGAKPRTIIARVHFYTEKERILRLRAGCNLDYNGHKVYIFPDYTAEVLSQRRSFRDVMQALRALQVTHTLRFPTKLCVQHNGQLKSFTSPAEAARFVESDLKQV